MGGEGSVSFVCLLFLDLDLDFGVDFELILDLGKGRGRGRGGRTFETDPRPEVFGELELCWVGLEVVDVYIAIVDKYNQHNSMSYLKLE